VTSATLNSRGISRRKAGKGEDTSGKSHIEIVERGSGLLKRFGYQKLVRMFFVPIFQPLYHVEDFS
jgi:hypothetical protein